LLPKEKEEGALLELLFDVFPKLNELELPEFPLLFVLLPKLNDEGEFVFPKLPPKVVVEVFELGVPNPDVEGVEKDPNDVPPVVEPNVEGVEVDDWPKEKADEVPVFDLFPKEKGEELVVEDEPKVLGVDEFPPKEKAEDEEELGVD
jgi:hypothetical protein